jgi:HD-GYP domain-containing protein (c-di-GMP phosphodiesterase class II)
VTQPQPDRDRDHAAEERLQRDGRQFVSALHTACQALRLYPYENATVQNGIDDVERTAAALIAAEGRIEVRVTRDFVFLNEARLRLDMGSIAAISYILASLPRHDLGGFDVVAGVTRSEWGAFLSGIVREPAEDEDPYLALRQRLDAVPVRSIEAVVRSEAQSEGPEDEAKEDAKRTYFQCVQVAQDVLTDVRLGRAVKVRRVKRAVQSVVDQVIASETSILGMTTLRDYDEYTFTHSVNVCILSVVMGQKVGLERRQLYELGFGALFHDIGKMRIDPELTKKTSGLTDDEWRAMQEHPTEGLLSLFSMQGFGEVPLRPMLMAYEHHMKVDLTGYPRSRRPRSPALFSRIVAVCDGFDAATSKRSYQSVPWPPDKVLREMRDNPKRGYDPLLVKVLINAMGVYPVGTLVILDSGELGIVVEPASDPQALHRPIVKLVFDASGLAYADAPQVDLAEVDPATGSPRRSVVKTSDPDKYGIDVGEYFL